MKENSFYEKQELKRKLKRYSEYKNTGFALGATAILTVILLVASLDLKTMTFGATIYLALGYAVLTALTGLVRYKLYLDISKIGEIRKSTRVLGYVMIATVVVGNIFAAIAGFSLVKKEKPLEYTVASYMVLIEVLIILVSFLNVFKDYVTNTYFLGLGLFVALTIFYVVALVLVGKYAAGPKVSPKFAILAVLLILSGLLGNLFAILLGIILLARIANRNSEVSIEWIEVIKRLCRNQMALLGAFIVVFLLAVSICSNLTFVYDFAVSNNYSALLLKPSLKYPFGTDDYGRCVFTRVIFGARISLVVGILSTALSLVVGVILGAIAGYYSNTIDNTIMRILDIFQAIPGLLLPIAIITAFGTSIPNIILALGVGIIPGYARTARATVMTLTGSEFVEAAKA